MAIPVLNANDVALVRVFGTVVAAQDMQSNLYFRYDPGLAPALGGVSLDAALGFFFTNYCSFWASFMSQDASFVSATMSVLGNPVHTGTGGSKWKAPIVSQWTVNPSALPGGVVADSLPAYCAYGVKKVLAFGGRGAQGHIRQWGIPETLSLGNTILLATKNAIQAGFNGGLLSMSVSAGTDMIFPVVMNGSLIRTAPGHPPLFYARDVTSWACSLNVSSQITRKLGRKRR